MKIDQDDILVGKRYIAEAFCETFKKKYDYRNVFKLYRVEYYSIIYFF